MKLGVVVRIIITKGKERFGREKLEVTSANLQLKYYNLKVSDFPRYLSNKNLYLLTKDVH